MTDRAKSMPLRRARRRTFFWFLGASIVLVILGLIGELGWLLLLLVGGVPLVIGLVLAVAGTRPRRGDPQQFNIWSQRAHAKGELELDHPTAEAKSIIRMAVADLEHFTVHGETDTGTEIRVRWSTKSWGEIITLTVEPLNEAKCRITGEVRPKIPTNILDFGQGAEDFAAILAQVEIVASNR